MISSFGILHSLHLRSLSISAVWLCVHCVNHASWFQAKAQCQSIGQSLGALHNTSDSFWSFYYTRRSHWMAALGCVSSLNGQTYKSFSMHFPSAGLCQELCMEILDNTTVFIVQKNRCICTFGYTMDYDLERNHCKFDCINDMYSTNSYRNNSCEEKTGLKAYSVFLSQPIVEQDGALLNATCVAVYCNTTRSFANDLFKLEDCKNRSLKSGSATKTQHSKPNPLVFRRQAYISHDRENITFSGFEKTNILLSCQLCSKGGCTFTNCNKKAHDIVCSKGVFISNLTSVSPPTKTNKILFKTTSTVANYSKLLELSTLLSTTVVQKQNATTLTTRSFSQEQTSTLSFDETTNESDIMRNYGIVTTSFLICLMLIGVFIFIIRKKHTVKHKGPITLKDTTELTSNRKEKKRSGGVSVANSPKSCLYSFADNGKLVEQTQYNQDNEVLYHHLRESVPTNNVNDDVYMVAGYKTSDEDNVHFGRIEDPYDHLRGTDRTRQEDDTYDHAPNVSESDYSGYNINVGMKNSHSKIEGSIYDHLESKEGDIC